MSRKAIIIGAGPAGLTAAYELLTRTDVEVTILEADATYVGGISKTVNHQGNRIDIGGHRFFSKSDRVMNWWMRVLPIAFQINQHELKLTYQNQQRDLPASAITNAPADSTDNVLLVRNRLSRIYYNNLLFPYPIKLSLDVMKKLGLWKILKAAVTFSFRKLVPRRPEKTLEDFFINRFGDELYITFFKSYTEKVWGTECKNISAAWGAQRIKGLNLLEMLKNAWSTLLRKSQTDKERHTSLIEHFLYPKFGPGQMWEQVRNSVIEKGATLVMGEKVIEIHHDNWKITGVTTTDSNNGTHEYVGDLFFSTMPISELIEEMHPTLPGPAADAARALPYRDFLTVGILFKPSEAIRATFKDNWIYIHDPTVHVGRIQIFNNWSEYMVKDPQTMWVGLEYFASEHDAFWKKSDDELKELGKSELIKLGIMTVGTALDAIVVRQPKAYPAYFGSYNQFPQIQVLLDSFTNLYCIGRNGMHRYNNQDHSMLTAMTAVDLIAANNPNKSTMWAVNTEEEYHEEKK